MSLPPAAIDEMARSWVIRIQDSAFDDWDGFTAWLEQAPDHLAAYEAALEDDGWAADLLLMPRPATDNVAPRRPRRAWWFAGTAAVAASLAAVVAVRPIHQPPTIREIATAPGEHRTVELADGSRIILNGDTRVTMASNTPRRVTLARGEALFKVRHDAADPFVVTAGRTQLLDIGTTFDVAHDGETLDVAVAEGSLLFAPGPQQVRLGPGDAVSRRPDRAAPLFHRVSPETVGSWQSGELQYTDASLSDVARDLARNLGRPVRVAKGAGRIRFTGTIVLHGPPTQVLARAGPLLGVKFAATGNGWTMSPADGSLQ